MLTQLGNTDLQSSGKYNGTIKPFMNTSELNTDMQSAKDPVTQFVDGRVNNSFSRKLC